MRKGYWKLYSSFAIMILGFILMFTVLFVYEDDETIDNLIGFLAVVFVLIPVIFLFFLISYNGAFYGGSTLLVSLMEPLPPMDKQIAADLRQQEKEQGKWIFILAFIPLLLFGLAIGLGFAGVLSEGIMDYLLSDLSALLFAILMLLPPLYYIIFSPIDIKQWKAVLNHHNIELDPSRVDLSGFVFKERALVTHYAKSYVHSLDPNIYWFDLPASKYNILNQEKEISKTDKVPTTVDYIVEDLKICGLWPIKPHPGGVGLSILALLLMVMNTQWTVIELTVLQFLVITFILCFITVYLASRDTFHALRLYPQLIRAHGMQVEERKKMSAQLTEIIRQKYPFTELDTLNQGTNTQKSLS